MLLTEILRPEMVWSSLDARTKSEAIAELCERIATVEPSLDPKQTTEILLDRERLGSTGIQDGIAIPHGKVPELQHIVIACGRSVSGIDFEAHDQKPTHLFFLLLAPEAAAGQHLKVLARLSKLLKKAAFRDTLMAAPDAREMYRLIQEEDERN